LVRFRGGQRPQPPTTGESAKYHGSHYTGIVARSDKDVWVVGAAATSTLIANQPIFLHWDGKSWAMLPVPDNRIQLSGLADDGAGGLWASATDQIPILYHFHPGRPSHAGYWSWTAMPSKTGLASVLTDFQRIPGTTSLWAGGELMDSQARWIDKSDAIFKYGR
jgi:hypothetical protein